MNEINKDFWDLADSLIADNGITIDRPKGSCHPKYQDYVYPLDYGYVNNTASQDGDGIDVWVGTASEKRVVAIISSIDIVKRDSKIKLLYSCTPEEIEMVFAKHNHSFGMKGILTIRENAPGKDARAHD